MILDKFIYKHPIFSKIFFSMLILAIFIMGKWIPLPFTYAKSTVENSPENLLFVVSGGSLQQMSLFSLGIQPWMTSMIIIDLFSRSKSLKLSNQEIELIGKTITMILALVQGFIIVTGLRLTDNSVITEAIVFLILIAGSFIVMWLSIMNMKYGLGSSMIIIMANIIQSAIGNLLLAFQKIIKTEQIAIIWLITGLIALIIFTYINVGLDKAEFRIPVIRILVDNNYTSKSYIPIKLTPAGAMPVMFGLGLMGLPVFIFQFLGYFYPQNQFIQWAMINFQFTKLPGVIIYMLILFILSLMFAYINVDPENLAKQLQYAGDYIPNVEPGRASERYIRKVLGHFALIGAIYLILISGLPLLWGLGDLQKMQLAMLPGYLLMLIGFAMTMMEQIRTIRIKHSYTTIFEGDE